MRFWLCLFSLTGCGYTLGQTEKMPGGFRDVYVVQAMDLATDVGPAATLTRLLRQKVAASRTLRAASREAAQVVLEARIDGISDSLGIGVSGNKLAATQYWVAVTGSVRLLDAASHIVWSGRANIREDYLSGLSPQASTTLERTTALTATESNRRRAIERATERLADELYASMLEGF